MKLQTVVRKTGKKSEAKQLRRKGMIPAVVYVRGKESEPIAVQASEIEALLRATTKGHLPTTKLKLVDETGAEKDVIVKDIQYHITNYKVVHLDFEELVAGVPVKVKVPIECTGEMECVGIKLGGSLRQVVRHLEVSCQPKDIPEKFELDIRELHINQHKRLSAIDLPDSVRPTANLNTVAAVISKR